MAKRTHKTVRYPYIAIVKDIPVFFLVIDKGKWKTFGYFSGLYSVSSGYWDNLPFIIEDNETAISITEEEQKELENNRMPPRLAVLIRL